MSVDLRWLAVAVSLVFFGACKPVVADCGPATCSGCCDASGACQAGFGFAACGVAGGQCQSCLGTQTCQLGLCTSPVSCIPKSCGSANCGSLPDGCGGTLNCGACAMGQSCGAGGVANQCGVGTCTPKTCAELGKDCGSVSDGCSAVLACGTCSSGTCGGGGTANVCGQGCVPTTCAARGKNCGAISDECGGMLSCGGCSGLDTCGGAGTANVCGSGCTPTTCLAQGKNCGTISDGCSAMLTCGTCSGNLTCGGGGTTNVCGATCAVTCPQGYTCSTQGDCRGGSPTGLVFDVKTFTVSGSVTLNGAVPPATGTYCAGSPSQPRAYVVFTDATQGYTVTADILCSSTTDVFSTMLFPGTYSVRVYGRGNNASALPTAQYLATSSFVVAGNLTGQVFDVRTFTVSGQVTLNGAVPPATGTYCAGSPSQPRAYVVFTDATKGYTATADILCSSATDVFSAVLYPGTYEVRVYGRGNNASPLPTTQYLANQSLSVTGNLANQTFDVRTFSVAGSVTLNGAVPPPTGTYCAGSPSQPRAYVVFTETQKGYVITADILCSSPTDAFSTMLFPGTYSVRVYGRGNNASPLPTAQYLVTSTFNVTTSLTGQVFDVQTFTVSGSVTLNGAVPPPTGTYCAGSPSQPRAYVVFTDPTRGYTISADILCSSPTDTFSTMVFPGTYEVRVYGRGNNASPLPTGQYLASSSFAVTGNLASQVFDVRTFTVAGSVTLNGAVPGATGTYCAGSPTQPRAYVVFTDETKGYTVSADILCSSPTDVFSTMLFPGTYEVHVYGRGNNASPLPTARYLANASLSVTGNLANQVFDVQTVAVSGSVTLNGAVPPPTGTYCAGSPTQPRAYVVFTEPQKGYTLTADILCSSPTDTFTTMLYPGSYEVRIYGRGNNASPLPTGQYLAASSLVIP